MGHQRETNWEIGAICIEPAVKVRFSRSSLFSRVSPAQRYDRYFIQFAFQLESRVFKLDGKKQKKDEGWITSKLKRWSAGRELTTIILWARDFFTLTKLRCYFQNWTPISHSNIFDHILILVTRAVTLKDTSAIRLKLTRKFTVVHKLLFAARN